MASTMSNTRLSFVLVAVVLAISAVLSQKVNAWALLPQTWVKKATSAGTVIALALGISTTTPWIANASMEGSYSDPNHPNCLRNIHLVNPSTAKLTGTDGNPGCPPDGSGTKWTLSGKVDGNDIFVDFSPKGGPKDLKGVFDGTGINWPDGNKWTLKD
mmetsp:Transcript_15910/g.36571  ORF Transcript_15910/g.36571 Transcript_15910/m.36571 type:complete len:158 (-) Transcript_15910:1348-1821(-)